MTPSLGAIYGILAYRALTAPARMRTTDVVEALADALDGSFVGGRSDRTWRDSSAMDRSRRTPQFPTPPLLRKALLRVPREDSGAEHLVTWVHVGAATGLVDDDPVH